MSYNFSTKEGQPFTAKMQVRTSADSYTLTAEFANHKFDTHKGWTPTLTVPVTSVGTDLTFNLTSTQVDTLKSSYFMIRAVKTGADLYLDEGKLVYIANAIPASSITLSELGFDVATQAELDAVNASLAPVAKSGSYADLTNKPTIPTVPVASVVGQTGAITGTQIANDAALRAAYVPKWKANTTYASGEFVLNPSGQIVSANSAFTSGASYSASNWTVVSGGGGSFAPLRTYDVKNYGAKGDVVILLDGAINSGSNALSCATSTPFVSSAFVANKLIAIAGAGPSGGPLVTTISGYTDTGHVTLAATASTTVSAKEVQFGTDDSAAFTACVAAAALEPVGAIINVPAGRYFTGQSTIYTRHQWQGAGPGSSVLMLKPGSTATSILQTQNFATLTGTSSNACPIQFSIRKLSMDGNSSMAPGAGRCLEVFGFEFDIDDVHAHRAVTDGMWLEYNGPQPVSTDPEVDFNESRVSNVKTMFNGNDGFHTVGVHDSMFANIVSAKNGGTGIFANASGNWLNCHSWGFPQQYAWQILSNETMTNCLGEGATLANWYLTWHYAKLSNCRSFAPRTTTTGLLIGKSGTIKGDDTTIWGMTVEGHSSSTGPAIDVTNAGSRLVLNAKTDQTSGTIINGTLPLDAVVNVAAPTTTIVQQPGATTSPDSSALTVGEETMPRYGIVSSNIAAVSQRLMLTYFTARKTESISQVVISTGTVAAGATPTLCRIGIYQIDAAGNGTLIASTANDTTLFAATFTAYTKALSASFTKVAGQRYALGVLVVSAAALPTFYGNGVIPTSPLGNGIGVAPRISGHLSGLSDLGASFTSGQPGSSAPPLAAALLP